MQETYAPMEADHPFWWYFKSVGHHETAALLYLGEAAITVFEDILVEMKKINVKLDNAQAQTLAPKSKTKTPPLDKA